MDSGWGACNEVCVCEHGPSPGQEAGRAERRRRRRRGGLDRVVHHEAREGLDLLIEGTAHPLWLEDGFDPVVDLQVSVVGHGIQWLAVERDFVYCTFTCTCDCVCVRVAVDVSANFSKTTRLFCF